MRNIPSIIEDRILKIRERFHKLNDKARQESNGAAGFITKPLRLDSERTFWNLREDEELVDFLFEDLLPALYGEIDPIDLSQLPCGYAPLVHVLEFERHCDFEGWGAVSNKSNDGMQEIIRSYEFVGLQEESNALRAVANAFQQLPDSEDENLDDILASAYEAIPNSTNDSDVRILDLLKYVRENPDHFY